MIQEGSRPLATLLLVDDEENILRSLRRVLRNEPYRLLVANGGDAALALLEQEQADLIICDARMPGMDGATLLAQVQQRWPHCMRILLTGYADLSSIINAINHGRINRYISKPWDDDELRLSIRQVLSFQNSERPDRQTDHFRGFGGGPLHPVYTSAECSCRHLTKRAAMTKIQLVDDEPHILRALQRVLHPHGWELHCFSDGEEALQALIEHEYALIIADYKMPKLDGITYLQFAKQRQPHAVRMLFSGYGDRQSMMQAINRAEIYRFLSKPWEDYEIETAVKAAIDICQLRSENQRLLAQVRSQKCALQSQQAELLRLEAKHPGLTRVNRDDDGALLFDGEEFGEVDHG